MTGAERQSKAEPDEDGKALGGSAVHYKRSSNTSTRRGGASLLSFFYPPVVAPPQSIESCNLTSLMSVQLPYNGAWKWNSPDCARPLPVVHDFSRVKRHAGN